MEAAPLRPVPATPRAPVADAVAVRRVESTLPGVDERARSALALVVLAGRSRDEAGSRLGLDAHELSVALTRARKELRRRLSALPGSGWCERAERLVSDRLDGALDQRSAGRLDAHLRNCPRCVEHERRLVQATDALVADVPLKTRPPGHAEAPQPAPPEPQPMPEPGQPPLDSSMPIAWYALLVFAILIGVFLIAFAVASALGP